MMRGGCGASDDEDEQLGGDATTTCAGNGSGDCRQGCIGDFGGGCAGGSPGGGADGVGGVGSSGGCAGQGACGSGGGGSGSGGGSGCNRGGGGQAGESAAGAGSWKVNQPPSKEEAVEASGTCIKCNAAPATVVINHKEHVCWECMDERVTGKARGPLLRTGLVQAGDSILVALSGGPGSWAALHVLRGLQSSNTQRPERGRVPLALGIAHVDESSVFGAPGPQSAAEAAAAVAEAAETAQGAAAAAPTQQQQQQQQALQQETAGDVVERWAAEHLPGACVHRLRLEDVFDAPATINNNGGNATAGGAGNGNGAAAAASGGAPGEGSHAASYHQQGQQHGQQQQQQQLADLLLSVRDVTGREDLVAHLRRFLLLRTAATHGYGTLALGTTSTATAVAVVAGAAKGRGYALPGDLQAWDARYGPDAPKVLHPLRALSSAEALLLCGRHSLPLCDGAAAHPTDLPACPSPSALLPSSDAAASSASASASASASSAAAAGTSSGGGAKSINELARRFVESMQVAVPSSTHTIVRTAGKLQAFPWNAPPERRRRDGQPAAATAAAVGNGHNSGGAAAAEPLCAVCAAPLTDAEEAATGRAAGSMPAAGSIPAAFVCRSCSLDIIGSGGAASCGEASETWRLLPQGMRGGAVGIGGGGGGVGGSSGGRGPEALRQQIAEFLIDDGDGEAA